MALFFNITNTVCLATLLVYMALPAVSVGFKEKAFWVNKQKVCESGTTSFRLTAPLNTTILDMKHIEICQNIMN